MAEHAKSNPAPN